MSKFGWDLPPGCTQKHIDDALGDDGITAMQDEIAKQLSGYIDEKYVDSIMELIRKGEEERFAADAAAEADAYADQLRDEKLLSDYQED